MTEDKPFDFAKADNIKGLTWDTGFNHENMTRVYCPLCQHLLADHAERVGPCLEPDCPCKGEDWNAGYQ
jgi:hypothetical protein